MAVGRDPCARDAARVVRNQSAHRGRLARMATVVVGRRLLVVSVVAQLQHRSPGRWQLPLEDRRWAKVGSYGIIARMGKKSFQRSRLAAHRAIVARATAC